MTLDAGIGAGVGGISGALLDSRNPRRGGPRGAALGGVIGATIGDIPTGRLVRQPLQADRQNKGPKTTENSTMQSYADMMSAQGAKRYTKRFGRWPLIKGGIGEVCQGEKYEPGNEPDNYYRRY